FPAPSRAWKRRYPGKVVRSLHDSSKPPASIRAAIASSSSGESTTRAGCALRAGWRDPPRRHGSPRPPPRRRSRGTSSRRGRPGGRTLPGGLDLLDPLLAVEAAEPAAAAAGQALGFVHLRQAHGVAVEAACALLLAAGHRHLHVMKPHRGSLVICRPEYLPVASAPSCPSRPAGAAATLEAPWSSGPEPAPAGRSTPCVAASSTIPRISCPRPSRASCSATRCCSSSMRSTASSPA